MNVPYEHKKASEARNDKCGKYGTAKRICTKQGKHILMSRLQNWSEHKETNQCVCFIFFSWPTVWLLVIICILKYRFHLHTGPYYISLSNRKSKLLWLLEVRLYVLGSVDYYRMSFFPSQVSGSSRCFCADTWPWTLSLSSWLAVPDSLLENIST